MSDGGPTVSKAASVRALTAARSIGDSHFTLGEHAVDVAELAAVGGEPQPPDADVVPIPAQIDPRDRKATADLGQAEPRDLVTGELMAKARTEPDQPVRAKRSQPISRCRLPFAQQPLHLAHQDGRMTCDAAKKLAVNVVHETALECHAYTYATPQPGRRPRRREHAWGTSDIVVSRSSHYKARDCR